MHTGPTAGGKDGLGARLVFFSHLAVIGFLVGLLQAILARRQVSALIEVGLAQGAMSALDSLPYVDTRRRVSWSLARDTA